MKKAGTMFIKNLRYLCLVGVIAIGLMTIVGTGGGGGGGGGTSSEITYTGLTTQAAIDENNAEDLAAGAYEGGHTGAAIGGIDAIQTGESVHIGRPRMLKVSQVLEGSLRQVDLMSRSGTFIGAIYTESGTFYGDCGGSASYTISIDDQTGDFNGSFNFNSYCDDGVTISGSVSFSGQADVNTGDLLRFTFSFNNLTGTSGSDSFTLNGNISWDVTISPATMTMTMLLQDNSTGKVYWVQNYTMTLIEGANYVDVELSGRYYDPDYGYVNITTTTPFRIYDDDDYPSDGVLVVTGNTGIAGSSTMARLTVLSSTTYQVEADTNSDGIYNWDSGVLNWGTTPTDSLLNKTKLLKGYWYFYYTIISTWDDYYTLDTITGDTNSQGGYYIYGIDKYGDPVIAAYWPDDGNWSLLDSGSIIDKFYTFYTDGNTILANSCYYQIDISTDDWSPCFTLNGYKVYSLQIKPKESIREAIESEEMKAAEAEEMRVVEGEEAIVDDSIEEKYRQMKQVIDSQK